MLQAQLKLKREMAEHSGDPYVRVIGDYLLNHLKSNPLAAEQITAEGKTILGSIEAMSNEARKRQVKGRAMLTGEEGFAIVMAYFGIKGMPEKPQTINIKLDDLL